MFPSPTEVIKMRDCFLLPHLPEEMLQLGQAEASGKRHYTVTLNH